MTLASNVEQLYIDKINSIDSHAGNLSILEDQSILPFSIKRIFYITHVPLGSIRGKHAHKKCSQYLICLILFLNYLALFLNLRLVYSKSFDYYQNLFFSYSNILLIF